VFYVLTNHPVATDNLDHLYPLGTKQDNFRNANFNDKLLRLLSNVTLMDLGCAGGGFVKDMIDKGQAAIGLEGSDYSLINKRAEWSVIPNNLFTCDITQPFFVFRQLHESETERCFFNVITCWEVMEHLPQKRLNTVFANIRNHLTHDGICIMSISSDDKDFRHITVQNEKWWYDRLSDAGFKHCPELVSYFEDDWIRGPKQCAPDSFHIVVRKNENSGYWR
jgi:2-polyprenyl-3-methyl-5-hydroxy-6-metoxy-1,4-benzoquinol methylase